MRIFTSSPRAARSLNLVLLLVAISLVACGGSEPPAEESEYNAAEEMDTGYDATFLLARLTDRATYEDPVMVEELAADFNALLDSLDFHTAKRQVKDLSVDFRNRPMRASMAAAVMDKWNQKPPAEITAADLEQAWAIRREEKKTEEQLAAEREAQYQDRLAKQEQVTAGRVKLKEKEANREVEAMASWLAMYQKTSAAGSKAVDRVGLALSDPDHKDDLGPACKALFQATQNMDGRLFAAPDPEIRSPLSKAWERFRTASRSCMKGEHAYLMAQLREGQLAMAQVDTVLKKYELSR